MGLMERDPKMEIDRADFGDAGFPTEARRSLRAARRWCRTRECSFLGTKGRIEMRDSLQRAEG